MERSLKYIELTRKHSIYIVNTLSIDIVLCYFYIIFFITSPQRIHYAVLLTVAAAYLFLCLSCFSRALCILVFFIPLQFSGVDTGYGILSITDMMIIELTFAWLVNKFLQRPRVIISSNCRFIIAWVFLIILSFANFLNPQTKISATYFLRLLSSITLFFVIYDQIRSKRQLSYLLKILVFSSFIVSLYGVIEFFVLKSDMPLLINGQLNNFKRVETFFHQPNKTAAYLVVAVPLIIYFIITENRILIKTLYAGALVVTLSCLTLTFSRAGWLCFTISILFLPFSKGKKVLILTVVISLVLCSVLSVNIASRLPSIHQRIFRYKHAVSQVMRKPFIGHGIRTYKDLNEQPHDFKSKAPHSIYLAVVVETGIPALLSFLLLIGCTAKRIIVVRNYTRNHITRDRLTFLLASCLLASFVSLFLMKFFETGLIKLSMWAMLAIYNLFPVLFSNTVHKKHRYAIYK